MGIALKVLGRIGAGAGGQLGGRGEAAHLPNRGAEVPQRTRGLLQVKNYDRQPNKRLTQQMALWTK